MEKRNVTVSAIVAAIVLIGDQLSKHWAETWLRTNGEYKIWDGVLHLRYVENRGAAFGMMQGGKWFFLAITGIACAAMLYFLIKERKRLHFMMTFSLALLLSGAREGLSTLLSIAPSLIVLLTGNVADMAVTVGCCLLVLDLLFFKGKKYMEMMDKKPQTGENS